MNGNVSDAWNAFSYVNDVIKSAFFEFDTFAMCRFKKYSNHCK